MKKELKEVNISLPITVVNEDGTPFIETPINPLQQKWEDKGYNKNSSGCECRPIIINNSDNKILMNYSCLLCSSTECYHSKYWVVPEEDKEAYNEYLDNVKKFFKKHNPVISKKLVL